MKSRVADRLVHKRVIVCCGAGGVGKTTVSASLAVALARRGRRVLIVTIDPSRRLAEVLGVAMYPEQPVPLSADKRATLGIAAPGALDAWMLDPKRVTEQTVRDVVEPSHIERFLENPIYRQLSVMAAGMHEYAAMKALHTFLASARYDTIVVDTPPSRHALDFLDAPSRLKELFDTRVMRMLRTDSGSRLRRFGANVALRTIQTVTGTKFAEDLVAFMTQFEKVFQAFERGASEVRRLLSTEEASFLLVTSPQETSVEEAFLFYDKARRMRLPVGGFFFNRSSASLRDWEFPEPGTLPGSVSGSQLDYLQRLARDEQQKAARDVETLRRVQSRAGQDAFVFDIPLLEADQGDLHRLGLVAGLMVGQASMSAEEDDAQHRVRA